MVYTSKLNPHTQIKAASEQLSSEVSGEAVILNINSGIYYGLNETGAKIWQWIQEVKTIAEIGELLEKEYDVESKQCQEDLQVILNEMLGAGLIEIQT